MTEYISKEHSKHLALLRQKKHRFAEGKVVVEGENLITQLTENGILPLEVYHDERCSVPPQLTGIPGFLCRESDMERICESKTPPGLAALYTVPEEKTVPYRAALYLDGISDPGNLGTIFRACASFGIGAILLSPDCAEVSSPKTIRASLGSVFWVPFRVMDHADLLRQKLSSYSLIMDGETALDGFSPPSDPAIYVIGSEAHGISAELLPRMTGSLRIRMAAGMESLNAAIATGILTHHLYTHGGI